MALTPVITVPDPDAFPGGVICSACGQVAWTFRRRSFAGGRSSCRPRDLRGPVQKIYNTFTSGVLPPTPIGASVK